MTKPSVSFLSPDCIRDILSTEATAVSQIPIGSQYAEAIELIHEHVHRRGGRLITSGMGKAGQIAANIATTFSSTGTPSYFLHPSEAQHGDLGILTANDVMLLISNSGKTREILELVELSRILVPDVPYICITGSLQSKLAMEANVCLHTGSPAEVCPLGLTPTTSTTVMTVMGDILVVGLMKAIGFNTKDYSRRHHGGYLGDRSRERSQQ